MEFKNKEQKLTTIELNQFINNFDLKLPKSYKEHILSNNGGKPELSHFKSKKIHYFHSIKHGDFEILESLLISLKDILPEDFFPFTEDEGGNQFCISLAKDNYGKIYFFPLDMDDSTPELLANSFEEFMEGLTKENNY